MSVIQPLLDLLPYILPFLVVLSVIVVLHELGHYLVARWNGVKITDFSLGFGPELFGFNDKAGTRWKVCAIPLGGFVKMAGDSDASSKPDAKALAGAKKEDQSVMMHHKKPWQKILISIAGPIANFLTAIVLFAIVFTTDGKKELWPQVGGIVPGSAAEKSGFQEGDVIKKITILKKDHTTSEYVIENFRDIMKVVHENAADKMVVSLERDGAPLDLVTQPQQLDDTSVPVRGLGISPPVQKYGLTNGIGEAITYTGDLISRILNGLVGMVTGSQSPAQLGGLFSIAKGAKDFWDHGLVQLFEFMAVLSVSLGVLNLLPIPVLDGGHVLFCAIEWIQGRPVSEKLQELAFRVGLYFLLALMIYAHWNDFKRFGVIEKILSFF